MAFGHYQFGPFTLDPAERQLIHDGKLVELSSRYFDALLLLLKNPDVLITKERFLQEVWQGIPVTDEVLTQCIKMLRKQLSDSATQPLLIATVPKHGYRFIGTVAWVESGIVIAPQVFDWGQFRLLVGAGTTGGGIAGLVGGLFFGFAATSQAQQSGIGALSALVVLVALATLLSLIGAASVVLGIASANLRLPHSLYANAAGGAVGGLIIGAIGKLVGMDAFLLLFGHSPSDITGAVEGLLLGGAVGLSLGFSDRFAKAARLKRSLLLAGGIGVLAGVLITLFGGHLLAGSLAQLADSFPDSRLHLDPFAGLLRPIGKLVTNCLECALFSVCLVGAMLLSRQ